jgi:hypothetical protein
MCLKYFIDSEINIFNSYNMFNLTYAENTIISIRKLNNDTDKFQSFLLEDVENNIKFTLNWNKEKNTYFLNDLINKKYETYLVSGKNEGEFRDVVVIGYDIVALLFTTIPKFQTLKDSFIN